MELGKDGRFVIRLTPTQVGQALSHIQYVADHFSEFATGDHAKDLVDEIRLQTEVSAAADDSTRFAAVDHVHPVRL